MFTRSTSPIKQRGISLIELIMFMVIISIAVAGILLVMNKVTAHSADTLVRKQALAIAESLLEEIELQAMSGVTPNPGTPANANRSNFDNVFNYNGYNTTAGILDFSTNAAVPGLTSYNVSPAVTVVPTAAAWGGIPAGSAVVITVSVTGPGGQIDVTGYRAGN
jgi:MSHA pilin protein MshD